MALLQVPDIRKLLRRRKGRSPITEVVTQADGLKRSGFETGASEDGAARPIATVEPKMAVSASKSRSAAELQRSYDQVMTLVRRIGDHLDAQAERQERLDVVVEKLPAAMDALPEITRQNQRMIDLLAGYLERADDREQTLQGALERLGGSARQQSEMLGLLHQQMQASGETSRIMADTLGDFRTTLGDLGESNRRAVDVLADMAAAADRRESKLEMILGRTQKWMIAALVCCGAAAVTALLIAVL
jgi:chromosome segregation ATPase